MKKRLLSTMIDTYTVGATVNNPLLSNKNNKYKDQMAKIMVKNFALQTKRSKFKAYTQTDIEQAAANRMAIVIERQMDKERLKTIMTAGGNTFYRRNSVQMVENREKFERHMNTMEMKQRRAFFSKISEKMVQKHREQPTLDRFRVVTNQQAEGDYFQRMMFEWRDKARAKSIIDPRSKNRNMTAGKNLNMRNPRRKIS